MFKRGTSFFLSFKVSVHLELILLDICMYGNLFTVYTLYGGGFKAHNAPCYLMGVKAVISDNF